MSDIVVLLVLPGLRERDLTQTPQLQRLTAAGDLAALAPSFPCLNGPVQANLVTGAMPEKHGIVTDAFFFRDRQELERRSWPAWLEQPAAWDVLRNYHPQLTTAAWLSTAHDCQVYCSGIKQGGGWRTFPKSVRSGQPLLQEQGRGASTDGAAWQAEAETAIAVVRNQRPDFFYLSCDRVAPVAERYGPDSAELDQALAGVDELVGTLSAGFAEAYGSAPPLWLITGGYAISPVTHVAFPNRILHAAELLSLRETPAGPIIDFQASQAWALVDRQVSHIYVADRESRLIERVARLFEREPGISAALRPEEIAKHELQHPRSGDVVLISSPASWQALEWWQHDAEAPAWASALGSPHQPGIDPRERWSETTNGSLAAVKGSYGAPARDESQRSFIASSEPGVLAGRLLADTDVYDLVLRQFGI